MVFMRIKNFTNDFHIAANSSLYLYEQILLDVEIQKFFKK